MMLEKEDFTMKLYKTVLLVSSYCELAEAGYNMSEVQGIDGYNSSEIVKIS